VNDKAAKKTDSLLLADMSLEKKDSGNFEGKPAELVSECLVFNN